MILQCEQCNTRFRLDDSKLKPGGVKVRCSKCRHVFIAGAEPPQEETDFDAILSGLGAPAPEKPAPSEPSVSFEDELAKEQAKRPAVSTAATAAFAPSLKVSFGEELASDEGRPAPATAESADVGAFSFGFEPEKAGEADDTASPGTVSFQPAAATTTSGDAGAASLADFNFEVEPSVAARPPVAESDGSAPLEFSEFDFNPEPLVSPEPPPAAKTQELDFGPLSFEEEGAAAPVSQPAGKELDFGELSFDAEPAAAPVPEPAGEELDFGELSFDAEPAAAPVPEPAGQELDFGELSFDAEPAAAPVPGPAGKELDFGEFAFEDEPATAPASQAAGKEPDFGELSFATETAAAPVSEPAGKGLDFGEFEFDTEPVSAAQESGSDELSFDEKPGAKTPATEGGGLDFGDISFDAMGAGKPAAVKETSLDFGDLAFDAEPGDALAADGVKKESGFDFGDFSFDEETVPAKKESAPEEGAAADFTFSSEPLAEETPAGPAKGAALAAGAMGAGLAAGLATAPSAAAATPAGSEPRTFSFTDDLEEEHPAAAAPAQPKVTRPAPEKWVGDEQKPTPAPHAFAAAYPGAHPEEIDELEEDELPPLSISSRRRGKSFVTASVVAVSLLAIAGLSGAGFYLLKSGPAAFEKVGLGFVPAWLGMQNAEEGRIAITNPRAAFQQNKEAGELFVVTGQAENQYKKPRASIHVRVTLFDKSGKAIMQKSAYCGNSLTNDQLATLPMAKIEAAMSNQFGDSLSNIGVKPGQKIPFVVAIPNVPKDAADFGVDVAGSTVAAQ